MCNFNQDYLLKYTEIWWEGGGGGGGW